MSLRSHRRAKGKRSPFKSNCQLHHPLNHLLNDLQYYVPPQLLHRVVPCTASRAFSAAVSCAASYAASIPTASLSGVQREAAIQKRWQRSAVWSPRESHHHLSIWSVDSLTGESAISACFSHDSWCAGVEAFGALRMVECLEEVISVCVCQPNEAKDRTAVFELSLTCETQFHSPMCITRKVLVAVAPGASVYRRLGIIGVNNR